MKIVKDKQKIDELLTRGVAEVIDRDHLRKKLLSGKQLRIKLGIDPTSPNLHIGRSVPLLKLRDFQELGHKIVFIIGDFTGVIGDTSDKDSERPMLDKKTIKQNMKSYAKQAGKILDMKKCEVQHNSKWLGKLTYADIGVQANAFSVAEFTARDNVKRRLEKGSRVSLREMLYPLMQGHDSVAIKADVELGGTDQRFNLLAGRTLQEQAGQEPQDIVMNDIIEGTDGRKMSSSWGNTINLTEEPDDMYGKVMSVPDELIIKYLTFVTRVPMKKVEEFQNDMKNGGNPRDAKIYLACELVKMYHGEKAREKAKAHFVKTIVNKEAPDEIAEIKPEKYSLIPVLVESGFAKSTSEAMRLISGGGVKVNGVKVTPQVVGKGRAFYDLKPGDVIQKGKRHFVRVA